MSIIWLNEAVYDLQMLRQYIARDNVSASKRIVRKILNAIELLSGQSGIGRHGRVLNTRELVVSGTPYIVPYRFKDEHIEILRILHSTMQWPERF